MDYLSIYLSRIPLVVFFFFFEKSDSGLNYAFQFETWQPKIGANLYCGKLISLYSYFQEVAANIS